MIKYAKILNEETGLCDVGLGTDAEYYKSLGMVEMNVDKSDVDDCWYLFDKCPHKTEEQKEEEERQRIANLTMTALDFIGVLQELGLTLVQINEYLEEHLELKMQLTYCQNVYCGVVCQLCPLTVDGITLTKEIVIQAFKNKHGEN